MFTEIMQADIIQGLRQIFGEGLYSIILYGSVARQADTDESDIDIAIVLKDELTPGLRDQFLTWSAAMDLKYDRVFSIIDIEKEKLDKWGTVLPFYKNVQEEGVVLWKAA